MDAIITATLLACLAGQVPVINDASVEATVYCPAYFGTRLVSVTESGLGVFEVPDWTISPEDFCSEPGCEFLVLSSLEIESACPDLFPAVQEEGSGMVWYGMYFYSHPSCPHPVKIKGGVGTVILFAQFRSVEFQDASWLFEPKGVPTQDVPADVVGLKPIAFLPSSRTMRMGRLHFISLLAGGVIWLGLYAFGGKQHRRQREILSG